MRTEGALFEDYLGDGAYVYLEPSGIIMLYTSNGIQKTNQIGLEPFVLRNFENWVKRVRKELDVAALSTLVANR